MAGIRSIGWWIPPLRRTASEVARVYGLSEEAVAKSGIESQPVPGDGDHPSTMGARATRAALDAAGLAASDLDLLIFVGVTKDWPSPWVTAFGVLHELGLHQPGATRAAGFDMSSRCAGGIDALWLAKTLVDSGTRRRVAVCCAERFDRLLGPQRVPEQATDAAYSAGAATAIVSADCDDRNEIVAFSSYTNPDLSVHKTMGPVAGGTRQPLDEAAIRERRHEWQSQLSLREVSAIARFAVDSDRHNYAELFRETGFDGVDFVACSPLDPKPQLDVLRELGVDSSKTLFTVPRLGHIGSADLLLILGVATASGRSLGRRIVMSTRTSVYSNALAIRSAGDGPRIDVGGEGIDVDLWRTPPRAV